MRALSSLLLLLALTATSALAQSWPTKRVKIIVPFADAWSRQGAVAMSMGTEQFARYMREDIEKWARIVKVSGAKPDR
jgi:tripartite-type tricarboxylate transporter receptor subunit TctC